MILVPSSLLFLPMNLVPISYFLSVFTFMRFSKIVFICIISPVFFARPARVDSCAFCCAKITHPENDYRTYWSFAFLATRKKDRKFRKINEPNPSGGKIFACLPSRSHSPPGSPKTHTKKHFGPAKLPLSTSPSSLCPRIDVNGLGCCLTAGLGSVVSGEVPSTRAKAPPTRRGKGKGLRGLNHGSWPGRGSQNSHMRPKRKAAGWTNLAVPIWPLFTNGR